MISLFYIHIGTCFSLFEKKKKKKWIWTNKIIISVDKFPPPVHQPNILNVTSNKNKIDESYWVKDRINTWQSMYDTLLPLTCCLTPDTLMHMYDHAVLGEKNNSSVCKNESGTKLILYRKYIQCTQRENKTSCIEASFMFTISIKGRHLVTWFSWICVEEKSCIHVYKMWT